MSTRIHIIFKMSKCYTPHGIPLYFNDVFRKKGEQKIDYLTLQAIK